MSETKQPRLGLPTQIAYGAGQIASQTFRDVPSLLLLFYMTNVLGIEPAIAGSAIFFPKLFGGIIFDVSTGILSDRWLARFKRRQWLLFGVIAAPAAMIALFHVPAGSPGFQTGYIAAIFSLYMLIYASFSVPYLGIAADLNAPDEGRMMLMVWRMIFTSLGVLLAGAVAPGFAAKMGGGQQGYEAMAVMLGLVCGVALLIAWAGARRAETQVGLIQRPAEQRSIGQALRGMTGVLGNRRFTVLVGITVLQLVGGGMAYAALLYFITYNMGRADALTQIGIVVLLASAGIIIGQPLWVNLAKKFGKKPVFIGAALLHAVANLGWGFSATGGVTALYVFALLLGIGNSGWAMLGNTMAVDIAGEGETGLYTASWMAADKIGFALGGSFMLGLILSAFGFDATRAAAGLPQSPSAVTGILVGFAIVPALANIIGAALFAKWGRG
jgi:glycoside/pentoside/hexuronide:cation symporter, GPH family